MDLMQISGQFSVSGDCLEVKPFGNGHINDTYAVTCASEGGVRRYILQKLNSRVFPHPTALMNNFAAVTAYLRPIIKKEGGDPDRECLKVIPTVQGAAYYVDGEGEVWRMTQLIENTDAYLVAESSAMFEDAGRAFGLFIKRLEGFDAASLIEVIPDFHNTVKRYENLEKAVAADKAGRASGVKDLIDFARARKDKTGVIVSALKEGKIPLRVTHNDTKLNNVLIDTATQKAICVIDLDTVMPGSLLYDFGDAIRVGCSTAEEDEKDLSKVNFDRENFVAFTRGFMCGLGDNLTVNEEKLLPTGAILMTFECGMRFLTDYLEGDVYFKTAYPEHNLVRCRTQFKLVEEMEKSLDFMQKTVDDIYFDILKGNKQKEA